MDPYTAAFVGLATKILDLAQEVIKGMPPEIKARMWERHMDLLDHLDKRAEQFVSGFKPTGQGDKK